jgi:hypothetical protein
MSTPTRVYISGAITGRPIDVAREQFTAAADALKLAGHNPIIPFDIPPHDGCDCPGTGDTAGAGGDLATLLDCDAILLLPGWHKSHGARRELDTATTAGIDVWWRMPDPVIDDVLAELARAEAKFGGQHLPDGTGDPRWADLRDAQRDVTDRRLETGQATWLDVALEEVYEAFAERNRRRLRAELVQVMAVCVRWIRDIDLREADA